MLPGRARACAFSVRACVLLAFAWHHLTTPQRGKGRTSTFRSAGGRGTFRSAGGRGCRGGRRQGRKSSALQQDHVHEGAKPPAGSGVVCAGGVQAACMCAAVGHADVGLAVVSAVYAATRSGGGGPRQGDRAVERRHHGQRQRQTVCMRTPARHVTVCIICMSRADSNGKIHALHGAGEACM
jgi:hypothetical protein